MVFDQHVMEVNNMKRTPTYSDEYIHHWGEVFTANNLHLRNLTFETFLLAPEKILAAIIFHDTHKIILKYIPPSLLPEQRAVQKRIDQEHEADVVELDMVRNLERDAEAHCSNGKFFEPMHHTAWPPNHGKGHCRKAHR